MRKTISCFETVRILSKFLRLNGSAWLLSPSRWTAAKDCQGTLPGSPSHEKEIKDAHASARVFTIKDGAEDGENPRGSVPKLQTETTVLGYWRLRQGT